MTIAATLELWSVERVAAELGVSKRAIFHYHYAGSFPPPVPVAGGKRGPLVWAADDIREWLKAGKW